MQRSLLVATESTFGAHCCSDPLLSTHVLTLSFSGIGGGGLYSSISDTNMRMRAPGCSESEPKTLNIVIGNSDDAAHTSEIATMINQAYGYNRSDSNEVGRRLRAGDLQTAGRVLHLAYHRNGTVVGCISSTPNWDGRCGQWGFLAVAVAEQGNGVAAALVKAAERRLAEHGCTHVQIEYMWKPCNADGRKLDAWYSRMGFETRWRSCWIGWCCCACTSCWNRELSIFRICRKPLETRVTSSHVSDM